MGEIVNRLATRPDALLVERRFFAENGLTIGGKFVLDIGDFRAAGPVTYTVADAFDVFPIVAGSEADYETGNFFVANAAYTFERMGKELPYDIVAETDPAANVEKMRAESKNAEVRMLLGATGNSGQILGLSKDWMYDVVKQVGNYGEQFERSVGMASDLKLERGQNQLWTKGGLMFSPVID